MLKVEGMAGQAEFLIYSGLSSGAAADLTELPYSEFRKIEHYVLTQVLTW